MDASRMGVHEMEEMFAKQTGYSRTTLNRVKFIRWVAENDDLPPNIQEYAKQHINALDKKRAPVMPIYEAIKELFRWEELQWEFECPACGTTFARERRGAVYCSNACRQRAYRERRDDSP